MTNERKECARCGRKLNYGIRGDGSMIPFLCICNQYQVHPSRHREGFTIVTSYAGTRNHAVMYKTGERKLKDFLELAIKEPKTAWKPFDTLAGKFVSEVVS